MLPPRRFEWPLVIVAGGNAKRKENRLPPARTNRQHALSNAVQRSGRLERDDRMNKTLFQVAFDPKKLAERRDSRLFFFNAANYADRTIHEISFSRLIYFIPGEKSRNARTWSYLEEDHTCKELGHFSGKEFVGRQRRHPRISILSVTGSYSPLSWRRDPSGGSAALLSSFFLRSSVGPVRWPAAIRYIARQKPANRAEPLGLWLREATHSSPSHTQRARYRPSGEQWTILGPVVLVVVVVIDWNRIGLADAPWSWPALVLCRQHLPGRVPSRRRGGREFNSTLDDVGAGSFLRVASIVLWELPVKNVSLIP